MVNQLLYGDTAVILDRQKKWSYIRLSHDDYEGWVDNKQIQEIGREQYQQLQEQTPKFCKDFMEMVDTGSGWLSIPLGARVDATNYLRHSFSGESQSGTMDKAKLIDTALMYLNTPYLWGGRSPFGIDCSGFTQMVYRLGGHQLLRDASQQATQGEALSFIEESEPGDLAFFDNAEGNIIHVGIMLEDNHIIHAHGKVRIDRIDHTGIFNSDTQQHSHSLRVIKRIV